MISIKNNTPVRLIQKNGPIKLMAYLIRKTILGCSFILLLLITTTLFPQSVKKLKTETRKEIKLTAAQSPKITINAPNAQVVNAPSTNLSNIELWFNSDGQLISYPPEILKSGENVSAHLVLDENFWLIRSTSILSAWVKTIENLKKYAESNRIIQYGIGDEDLVKIENELGYKILNFINRTNYISLDLKKYYTSKIKALGVESYTPPAEDQELVPTIDDLVTPVFTIEYSFFDINGGRIDKKGKPYCQCQPEIYTLNPCQEIKGIAGCTYKTDLLIVPKNCFEIKYELRLKNNVNAAVVAWSNLDRVEFPKTYKDIIQKEIIPAFGDEFMKKLETLNADIKKLVINPLDPSVNIPQQESFVAIGLSNAKTILTELNNPDEFQNKQKPWVLKWLWLTNGIPKMNPFNDQAGISSDQGSTKVSPQDKALYQIFDNMVSKGVLKISDLKIIDAGFTNIPKIKAALDAEASQKPNEPKQLDRLIYNGLLKVSPNDSLLYMRHLDVQNNYTIMAVHAIKEITEKDRMYVLAENKPVPLNLSLTFSTTSIASEDSRLTIETALSSAADDFEETSQKISVKKKDATTRNRINAAKSLMDDAKKLVEQIVILRALSQIPVLPLDYRKDETADFITFNLVHDYLYDAPATASYSVKQINTDNTEKEVAKGSYRINKLYRFRLKAGLIYSFFKKTDYTETSPNIFSVDNSAFGIDGTFGIQTFLTPPDIRSSKTDWSRAFLYTGFSMKKISENYYIGVGVEPWSGLTFGLNAHIGKREALTGTENVPSAIRTEWGVGLAPFITIDPSLFVRLFTFGNTNKSLISF